MPVKEERSRRPVDWPFILDDIYQVRLAEFLTHKMKIRCGYLAACTQLKWTKPFKIVSR